MASATRAFCSSSRPLVTAAPTYGTPESTARRMGVGVRSIPVDESLGLDLGAMAEAARGAGMVFVCNPNNPTGTAHPAAAIESFVREVKRASPETAILIDEAYIDYTLDPDVRTVAPLTQELPGVFITRSFSKAHGMAGLRIGYTIGQAETVDAIAAAWGIGSMNTLSAAAAAASLSDQDHIAEERRINARIRESTMSAFREHGLRRTRVPHQLHLRRSRANRRGVPLGLPGTGGVRVGRDFPPLEHTYSRISLGTQEEMEASVAVFREVLGGTAQTGG